MDVTLDLFGEVVSKLPSDGGKDFSRQFKNKARAITHTGTEQFRHRCEVRWLLSERTARGRDGILWLRGYLGKLPEGRRKNLEKDIRCQWTEGNRVARYSWAGQVELFA